MAAQVRLLNEAICHDFASLIVATFWTDAMLHARLLTIGTDHRLGDAQRIVRPALAATCF